MPRYTDDGSLYWGRLLSLEISSHCSYAYGGCLHSQQEISRSDSDPRPLLVTAITCSCLEGRCLQEKSTPWLHLCVLRAGTESCSFRRKTTRTLPLQGPASAPAPPETTRSCTHLHQSGREAQPSKRRGKPTPKSYCLPSGPPQVP